MSGQKKKIDLHEDLKFKIPHAPRKKRRVNKRSNLSGNPVARKLDFDMDADKKDDLPDANKSN